MKERGITHYVNVPLPETTYQQIKHLAFERQCEIGEIIAEYLAEILLISSSRRPIS